MSDHTPPASGDGAMANDPRRLLAAVLEFARFSAPTGDIEEILQEIKTGARPVGSGRVSALANEYDRKR